MPQRHHERCLSQGLLLWIWLVKCTENYICWLIPFCLYDCPIPNQKELNEEKADHFASCPLCSSPRFSKIFFCKGPGSNYFKLCKQKQMLPLQCDTMMVCKQTVMAVFPQNWKCRGRQWPRGHSLLTPAYNSSLRQASGPLYILWPWLGMLLLLCLGSILVTLQVSA